jgi:hypothetical protein
MDSYIAIREYDKDDFMHMTRGLRLSAMPDMIIPDGLRPSLLKLDSNLLLTAFNSFDYMNWLKEFAREIDVDGSPLYPKLTKTVETVILYLKDLGVPTAFILKAMLAQEEYLNFLIQVDEFGKTVIE